jgi:hypothetical protein
MTIKRIIKGNQLGKAGAILRSVSGVAETRNSTNTSYGIHRAADPVGDNDLVTKRYLDVRNGVVTGQINGGSPPAVVNGAMYICSTAGGVYVRKSLYRGESSAWVAYTPYEGQVIKVTDALSGGSDTYSADHIYLWDADTSAWLDQGSASDLTSHTGSTTAHGATGANVGTTNTQTLTNKTLTDPVLNDTTGPTKQAHFVMSTITAGQNRALTLPDKNIIVADDADLDTLCPGIPTMNRLRLLGAPGAAVEGNTVTIGADVYEFRASTPPAGGTAGRIWVYNDATSAASRTNLIDAINGVVDAARITRDGTNTELVVASAGITTGDIVVQSSATIGGTPAPSATPVACSDGLDTATDIWDAANTYNGIAQQPRQVAAVSITLSAAMIAKGNVQAYFSFTPRTAIPINRSRPQNEVYTITGNAVSLTLAGGASPNNQAADVIDIIAFA